MKKQIYLFIIILLSISVIALLFSFFFIGWLDTLAYDKKLTGYYHLIDDLSEKGGKAIYYQSENGSAQPRVLPNIKEVGWDEQFLIVKQIPAKEPQISYYIIQVKVDRGLNPL